MFNINFANDWIQIEDLRYWKRPHFQLSHNHFPFLPHCLLWVKMFFRNIATRLFNFESFLKIFGDFLGYFELFGLFWEISANYCNIFCVIWWFWGQIWEVLITANFCMFDLGYLMILYLKISDNVSSYFAIFRVYLVFEKYLEPTLAYFGCCKRPNIEHII